MRYFFSIEMRSCYMVNAQELLTAISGEGASSSKMSGLLVGCLVDISTGELSFLANGKETDHCFFVEPNTNLYPAVFVAPTSKETVQFELGRIKVSSSPSIWSASILIIILRYSTLCHYQQPCLKVLRKAFRPTVHPDLSYKPAGLIYGHGFRMSAFVLLL